MDSDEKEMCSFAYKSATVHQLRLLSLQMSSNKLTLGKLIKIITWTQFNCRGENIQNVGGSGVCAMITNELFRSSPKQIGSFCLNVFRSMVQFTDGWSVCDLAINQSSID